MHANITLTASDLFEIDQNRMRIGVCVADTVDERGNLRRCDCVTCVEERSIVEWPKTKPKSQPIIFDRDHKYFLTFVLGDPNNPNAHFEEPPVLQKRGQVAQNYIRMKEPDRPYQVRSIPVGFRVSRKVKTSPVFAASAGHEFMDTLDYSLSIDGVQIRHTPVLNNGTPFVYDRRFDSIPWVPCGIPEFIDDQIVGNFLMWLFLGKKYQRCVSLLPLSVTPEPDGTKPRRIKMDSWMDAEPSKTDPNLGFTQRYALDRMHWAKHYIRGKNSHYGDGFAHVKRPRSADKLNIRESLPGWNEDPFDNVCWQCGEAHGSCDSFFAPPYMEPTPRYPKILYMVSDPPRQSLYGGNDDLGAGAAKNNIWTGEPEDWTPGHGLPHLPIILYNLDRRIRASAEYRPDPLVSREDGYKVEQELRKRFEEDLVMDEEGKMRPRLKYYPNDSFTGQRQIFETVRDTDGSGDEMLLEQKKKLEQFKRVIKRSVLLDAVEKVLLGSVTHSEAAYQLQMTDGQFRTAMSRLLNRDLLGVSELWNSVLVADMPDGLYALAKFDRVPLRAYLIVPAADFTTDHGQNQKLSDDGLHNAICNVLERRIRNGRVARAEDLSAMYREVYDEFTPRGLRVIVNSRLFPFGC